MEPVTLTQTKLVIIEGAYSCRPDLWELYDLHAFLTVEKETQRKRILARNGAEAAARFEGQWIPLEETYFETYRIQEKCELCFLLQEEG